MSPHHIQEVAHLLEKPPMSLGIAQNSTIFEVYTDQNWITQSLSTGLNCTCGILVINVINTIYTTSGSGNDKNIGRILKLAADCGSSKCMCSRRKHTAATVEMLSITSNLSKLHYIHYHQSSHNSSPAHNYDWIDKPQLLPPTKVKFIAVALQPVRVCEVIMEYTKSWGFLYFYLNSQQTFLRFKM